MQHGYYKMNKTIFMTSIYLCKNISKKYVSNHEYFIQFFLTECYNFLLPYFKSFYSTILICINHNTTFSILNTGYCKAFTPIAL